MRATGDKAHRKVFIPYVRSGRQCRCLPFQHTGFPFIQKAGIRVVFHVDTEAAGGAGARLTTGQGRAQGITVCRCFRRLLTGDKSVTHLVPVDGLAIGRKLTGGY